MPDLRDILLSVIVGAFFGVWLAVWAQGHLDERAVSSGYAFFQNKAYRLSPVPTPTNPNSRSGQE